MKNLIAIVLLSLGFTAETAAQNEVMVYLKNGSQIKGELKESEEDEKLELILSDGSLLLFDRDNVEHIDQKPNEFQYLKNGRQLLVSGTYRTFAIQYMTAKKAAEWQDDRRIGFGASFSMGHQFIPELAVGAGTGIDIHEEVFMPVFVEVSGMLHRLVANPKKDAIGYKIPLTYTLQTGYNLPFEEWIADPNEFEKIKGGWMVYPSLGLSFPSRDANTVRVEVGYKFQRFTRKYEWDWSPNYEQKDVVTLKSFTLKAGLLF